MITGYVEQKLRLEKRIRELDPVEIRKSQFLANYIEGAIKVNDKLAYDTSFNNNWLSQEEGEAKSKSLFYNSETEECRFNNYWSSEKKIYEFHTVVTKYQDQCYVKLSFTHVKLKGMEITLNDSERTNLEKEIIKILKGNFFANLLAFQV